MLKKTLMLFVILNLCAAVILPLLTAGAATYTPVATDYYNGHKYAVYDDSMTWEDAKTFCENLGGHLITITSANEQKYVESLLSSGKKKQYWIGASDISGNWQWVTGEKWDYTNWCAAQPDDYEKDSYYAQILKEVNKTAVASCRAYSWNDITNTNTSNKPEYFSPDFIGFICEWDTENITESEANSNSDILNIETAYGSYQGSYKISASGVKNCTRGLILTINKDYSKFISYPISSDDTDTAFEYYMSVQYDKKDGAYVFSGLSDSDKYKEIVDYSDKMFGGLLTSAVNDMYDLKVSELGKTISGDILGTYTPGIFSAYGKIGSFEVTYTANPDYSVIKQTESTNEKQTEKPSASTVSINKTSYTPGENIVVSWTKADLATGYDIHIAKEGLDKTYRIDSISGSLTSSNITITDEGNYSLAVYSTNSAGYTGGTNWVKFTVKKTTSVKTGYVSGTGGANLNLRSNPTTGSSIVAKMPEGAALMVTGDAISGFYPVSYNGKTGYASASYITFSAPQVSSISSQVGKRIANVYSYPAGSSYIGECVWYVRGRAKEKLGINTGITGHGCQWYAGAKARKLSTGKDVRSNSIACFGATKNNSYGYVIFVEEVIGDNVYYTEANVQYPISDGKISSLDGVLKVKKLSQFKTSSYQGCIYLK